MADFVTRDGGAEQTKDIGCGVQSRKEKRKALKKQKRKQARVVAATLERQEEEARLNSPEEQLLIRLREQEEAEQAERVRREFEERERVWLEEATARKAREEEHEQRKKLKEEEDKKAIECPSGLEDDDDEYEYVEEGPPEIIWQGNEIIIKKKRVKIAKRTAEQVPNKEDDRPTSNPLPPQSAAFASYAQSEPTTVQEVFNCVAQQVPNFGTEQDKAHCPFHLKTGVCRFGSRCSRVHFYPEKSCTLLVKNMYNGPGLTCEQDEGLEFTDEEVERCYEEFYEDVHTEFLKFGEIVNFKVCKNTSYHLRGNLYVHYKFLESAIIAYNTMNARYYAGKQIVCEFAGVTKWKVAICGEFMKSRLKTCSHGSACNFIHCFRNPGGDYEWANWDNPPPRFWIKKMVVLFGTSAESSIDKELESVDYYRHRDPKRIRRPSCYRHQSEKSHYIEMDMSYSSSDGDESNSRHRYANHSTAREHSSRRRGHRVSADKDEQFVENHKPETHSHSRSLHNDVNVLEDHRNEKRHESEARSFSRRRRETRSEERENAGSEDRSSSRRKRNVYSEEWENPDCMAAQKSHKKRDKKLHRSSDRKLSSSDNWEPYEDLEYCYGSQSGRKGK